MRRTAVVAVAIALAIFAVVARAQPVPSASAPPTAGDAPGVAAAGPYDALLLAQGSRATLLDQITGVSSNSQWSATYFTDSAEYSTNVADDMTLVHNSRIEIVEAVFGGWNGFVNANPITHVTVNVLSAAFVCGSSLSGDVFSLTLAKSDPRVTIVPRPGTTSYIVRIDLSASNVVAAAGVARVSVSFTQSFAANGQVGLHVSSTAGPFAGNNQFRFENAGAGFGSTCQLQTAYAMYRVLGRPVCANGAAVEFKCANNRDAAFEWCVFGTGYSMQCAPGSGCEAGTSSLNPCTLNLALQSPPAAPACGGASGSVCVAGESSKYYVCSEAFKGWMPCAAGTTCKAPAGTVVTTDPCW